MADIRFPCPHCGATIRTAAATAGRTGKCPRCSAAVTIPVQAPAERTIAPQPEVSPTPVAAVDPRSWLARPAGIALLVVSGMILSGAVTWALATRGTDESPLPAANNNPPTTEIVPAGVASGAAAQASSTGFATPVACFDALREGLKANDTAVLVQCMSDEMLLITAAQSAFQLQREAFMNPQAAPEGKELLKKYQLDDIDIMGMLQEADMGGGGVPAALRKIGESISDPLAFQVAAHKILNGDKPLLRMPEELHGTLAIQKIEGDVAFGEVKIGEQPGLPLYFKKQADGWRLSLPPEDLPRQAERRSLPTRPERDRIRSEREQAEQLRASRQESHSAIYRAAKLFGTTTGEFELFSTGTDSRPGSREPVIGDGSVAPIYVRFEGGSQPIILSDLSEEDAAYFIQLPYAERDSKPVAEALVKPDSNGRSIYSNHQGTQATFVNGRLTHFLTNSPFTEFSVTRRGESHTLPMTVAEARELFGEPISTTSDRDKRQEN